MGMTRLAFLFIRSKGKQTNTLKHRRGTGVSVWSVCYWMAMPTEFEPL